MRSWLLLVLAVKQFRSNEIDDTWMQFLSSPPLASVELAQQLQARANGLAQGLAADKNLSLHNELDVVISGGGNYDAYYMGIRMVLGRVSELDSSSFTTVRHAGASAGGMMPFEVALKVRMS